MLLTKKENCRIKQINKINPLNLAVIHNRAMWSTPRKAASLKKEEIYFQQGVLLSLFWLVWYNCTGNAIFFLKLQSTSQTEREVEGLHKNVNMITECCFANAIKMYIAHFRLLKLCGVFITSPVSAVRSNFLIVSISLCWFCSDVQCISGKCRAYPGNRSLCAGDRVEAVTALDILYNDFHRRVYGLLNSSGEERSCGMNYTCPDGEHLCQTRYEMLRHVH